MNKVSIKNLKVFFGFNALLMILFYQLAISASDVIPTGNGTWIYDGTYDTKGTKGPIKAGLFIDNIKEYNKCAKAGHKITQLFVYGGDLEGPGASDVREDPSCLDDASWSAIYYLPQQFLGKNKTTWNTFNINISEKGDSGFASAQAYTPARQFQKDDGTYIVKDSTGIKGAKYKVLVIDGRVDSDGYLQGLNDMSEDQARGFADKVSITICADQSIDGVQFDLEPFSFSGEGGVLVGAGQMFFYQQIAKNFAGWYGKVYDSVKGINLDIKSDPIHAVSDKHPNGRFFSVFTFAKSVTKDVRDIYTKFGNFYIVDSLYDLDSIPGGQSTSVATFTTLVTSEINAMKTTGMPYQFAIPAAASCHEFESCDGVKSGCRQVDYVKAAIEAINDSGVRNDLNFKGINLWSWNQSMWWKGKEFTPSFPQSDVITYLQSNL